MGSLSFRNSFHAAHNYLSNKFLCFMQHVGAVVKLLETPIPPGYVRFRWTCRCGFGSYDDLAPPGNISDDISGRDLSSTYDTTTSDTLLDGNIIHAVEDSEARSGFRHIWTNIQQAVRNQLITLAKRWRRYRKTEEILLSHVTPGKGEIKPPSDESYLLVCVDEKGYSTGLHHIPVGEIKSDKQLFEELRAKYDSVAASRCMSRWLSSKRLQAIHFVEFALRRKQLVDNIVHDEIPPFEHRGYDYDPKPADRVPPLGWRYLMHLYEFPEDGDSASLCLKRFPKKLRGQLHCGEQDEENLGWGVYFIEARHVPLVAVFGFLALIFCSVLFGILYWHFKHDLSGAFTISGVMSSTLSLFLGIWAVWMFPTS